jgi:uncharacterized repeat protein (TIGR01451 family)
MKTHAGTAVRIAVLLGALFTALTASSQVAADYALELFPSGVPYPGGEMGLALVVTADWWTDAQEPFVVELTVPPGFDTDTRCEGDLRLDAATRVLTWSHRMDDESIAFSSCHLRFRIDLSVVPGSTFSLSAKLSTSKPDPNPSNDTATVTSLVYSASDLEVRSSADRRTLKPGETITYTLEIRNLGPQTAHDVRLTDHIPGQVSFVSFEQTGGLPAAVDAAPNPRDGDCFPQGCSGAIRARFTLMPAGSAATFRLVVVVNPSSEGLDIRNRLTADTPSFDVDHRNNVVDEWVAAGPDADLAITSQFSHTSGARSTVLLRIVNEGPEGVNGVTVHGGLDTAAQNYDFADLVRYMSVTPSQGTCTTTRYREIAGHPPPPDSWGAECQVGLLGAGEAVTIAVVIESSPGAGAFHHSAVVRPAQNDPLPQNNHTQLTMGAPRRRSVRQ